MRQLGMVGTTFRRAGQTQLARYTFAADVLCDECRRLHSACGFLESVYLATCNRVEIIFVGDKTTSIAQYRGRIYDFFQGRLPPSDSRLPTSPDFRHAGVAGEAEAMAPKALHAYGGEGAAEHLFCVAAALDSMNPGEAQILGQVKEAYRRAQELGLVGKRLALIFEEAFEAAKHVRNDTELGAGVVSMLSLSTDVIEARLASGSGRLAIIGVGDMARQCGEIFGSRPGVSLLFVNRTVSRAQALAQQYGGEAMSLASFLKEPGTLDVVVTATAASEPFLGDAFFAALVGAPPLVVDLAIPRDTEFEAARRFGVEVYDIDRLDALAAAHRKRREAQIAEARDLLDQRLVALRRRVVDRDMGAVVRKIRARYEGVAQEALEVLFSQRLTSLSDGDRQEIEKWLRTLINRCAHVPTVGLKQLAHEHGLEAVEAFLAAVGETIDDIDA